MGVFRFPFPLRERTCEWLRRTLHNKLCVAVALALATFLTGCNGGDPIQRWQTQVKEYINDEHNGDINALRHYGEPVDQRTFSMIGASGGGVGLVAPERADTTGVLLGRSTVGENDWHIVLVGVIRYRGSFAWLPLDDSTVEDIRLAAFHLDRHDHFVWRISEPDDSQLAKYITVQHKQWVDRFAGHDDISGNARTIFPWEGDTFDVEVNEGDETITVHERTSGARWTLHLVPESERKLAMDGEVEALIQSRPVQ
jgi:hypothetical protein